MLRLMLFDLLRAVRPSREALVYGHVTGFQGVPPCVQVDLGLGNDMQLTRAFECAEAQLTRRRQRDAAKLLTILSDIA